MGKSNTKLRAGQQMWLGNSHNDDKKDPTSTCTVWLHTSLGSLKLPSTSLFACQG